MQSHSFFFQLLDDDGRSDYVVVFLRLLTSGELQGNSEFYASFLDGTYATVKDFCAHVSRKS